MLEPFDQQMKMIGQRLRAARVNAGLTQSELAKLCLSTLTTVSDIETGKGNPKVATILLLCRALHINPSQILDELHPPV